MSDSIERLYQAVRASRDKDPLTSRTGRLLRSNKRKIAKKVAEEAAEVAIEAVAGNRGSIVSESADLVYHLTVLWFSLGIDPADVWAEMERREKMFGIAEKMPKGSAEAWRDKQPVSIERARRRRAR